MHYNLKQKLAFQLTYFFMVIYVNKTVQFSEINGKYRNLKYIFFKQIVLKTAIPKPKGGDSGEKQSN